MRNFLGHACFKLGHILSIVMNWHNCLWVLHYPYSWLMIKSEELLGDGDIWKEPDDK